MWKCLSYIRTFFGYNPNNPSTRINIEKEVNFLVFWGKIDRYSVIHMPLWKRKLWVDLTLENLKMLYGKKDGGTGETKSTRPLSAEVAREMGMTNT